MLLNVECCYMGMIKGEFVPGYLGGRPGSPLVGDPHTTQPLG